MNRVIRINGTEWPADVPPTTPLSDFLREHAGLTGTKIGCRTGECGACTVLLDGRPVTSCLVWVARAWGRDVTTVEGLGDDQRLDPVQVAFLELNAAQCGFCIPGLLVSARALLDEAAARGWPPTALEVRERLSGHLCRCTGYQKIVEAVLKAAENGMKEMRLELG